MNHSREAHNRNLTYEHIHSPCITFPIKTGTHRKAAGSTRAGLLLHANKLFPTWAQLFRTTFNLHTHKAKIKHLYTHTHSQPLSHACILAYQFSKTGLEDEHCLWVHQSCLMNCFLSALFEVLCLWWYLLLMLLYLSVCFSITECFPVCLPVCLQACILVCASSFIKTRIQI